MASTSTTSNNNPPPEGPEGGSTSVPVAGGVAGGEAPATKKRSRLFCSYCKKANHTADTCRAVPGTVTILSGGGAMAPTGCTFRVATGRVEKKKNNKNKKKKKNADQKLADKVSESVSAMQIG
ncbi:hypothetical protein FPANT_9064 [Fusarium pseudoanthophilum]|uniref:Uncharacterized protein n=1 Tax=Fusarium pseudoanthophilum TaxID=48495 RepID=A0A8H5KZW3_9HYPO|nr:hypothetical protein FPANT_9064 [Fusarium pseudoanthophilum]